MSFKRRRNYRITTRVGGVVDAGEASMPVTVTEVSLQGLRFEGSGNHLARGEETRLRMAVEGTSIDLPIRIMRTEGEAGIVSVGALIIDTGDEAWRTYYRSVYYPAYRAKISEESSRI
jgi:hypothetical protein